MSVVLVTEPEYRKAEAVFASASPLDCRPAPADEDALAEAVRAAAVRFVIVGGRAYRGPLYDALPPGGVIARFGVGYDGIDRAEAARRGLLCTNTPGVLAQSVAEHALLLMLAAARRISAFPAAIHSGRWIPPPPVGMEMAGKTLAVIGCGQIGRATARIAKRGFGMRVIGVSRSIAIAPVDAGDEFDQVTDDVQAAIGDAHFVSLHMPARPENAGFMNRARLARLRADAWLINTARGALVDEAALYDALAEGRLGGAALDVFADEPYRPVDPDRDLRRLPNVVLTPHVGSHTVEANRAMAERALGNIRLADAGRVEEMDLLPPAGAHDTKRHGRAY